MQLFLASTFEGFKDKFEGFLSEKLGRSHVVCVPTAAYGQEGFESFLYPEMDAVKRFAKGFEELDIAGKSHAEIKPILDQADIIYVTGGNTYHLLNEMNKSDFKLCLDALFERGGMYLGCSAGAIVTGPRIDFIEDMDENKCGLKDFTGLALVDFLFMPHIDHEKYGHIAMGIIGNLKLEKTNVIGLKDDQALYVDDQSILLH